MYHGSIAGAASAFFLGYALDSCSGAPVGVHALAMCLVFTTATLLSHSLWTNNPLSVFGLVACAVFLKAITVLTLLETEWAGSLLLSFLTQHVVWDLLFALLLTPLIFSVLAAGERVMVKA